MCSIWSSPFRYERRGWVTYTHSTDIKEASNQLGTVKVKDCTLSCSVNRELTRRVKQATAATWTRKAVHSDLQLAVKFIRFVYCSSVLELSGCGVGVVGLWTRRTSCGSMRLRGTWRRYRVQWRQGVSDNLSVLFVEEPCVGFR